jgi:dihydroneopterin aldolase
MPNQIFTAQILMLKLNNAYRRIFLQDYEVNILLGIFEHEQKNAQKVVFNVEIFVPLQFSSSKNDNFNEVLDYNIIIHTIQNYINTPHNLQETLCDKILEDLLKYENIHAVGVCMYKAKAYEHSAKVGVERFKIKQIL